MILSVGCTLGYQIATSDLERSIDKCTNCRVMELDATASGAYVAPFFRVTFGSLGIFALVARSEWFLTSDLVQMTSLGFEAGLP